MRANSSCNLLVTFSKEPGTQLHTAGCAGEQTRGERQHGKQSVTVPAKRHQSPPTRVPEREIL